MRALNWIALIILVIGGLNWLFVALFSIDLVGLIFGSIPILTRLIYFIVGIAALYVIIEFPQRYKF